MARDRGLDPMLRKNTVALRRVSSLLSRPLARIVPDCCRSTPFVLALSQIGAGRDDLLQTDGVSRVSALLGLVFEFCFLSLATFGRALSCSLLYYLALKNSCSKNWKLTTEIKTG